jgi:hypothetical protein
VLPTEGTEELEALDRPSIISGDALLVSLVELSVFIARELLLISIVYGERERDSFTNDVETLSIYTRLVRGKFFETYFFFERRRTVVFIKATV